MFNLKFIVLTFELGLLHAMLSDNEHEITASDVAIEIKWRMVAAI